ncbi:MAG: discoidin domain-containing protein, partial [Bacteroidales bacterium]
TDNPDYQLPSKLSELPFNIPVGLAAGDYRARLVIDWASDNPCGATGIGGNGGAVVDFIIRIAGAPAAERTITLKANPSVGGTVEGGGTHAGAIRCIATAKAGYVFVNWTNEAGGAEVSKSATYTDNTDGNKTFIANFARDPKLSRTGWVASVDSYSESGGDGPAGYAIDGNTATWWHSQWTPSIINQPHWILFDLGKSQSFTSFNYVSRSGKTDVTGNGNIANYELYVSDTEADVKSYVASKKVNSGTFTYNSTPSPQDHMIKLPTSAKGRYVLLKSLTAANGLQFASCAEFYLYLDAFIVSVAASDATMGDVYIGDKGVKTKELDTDGTATTTLTAEAAEGYHFVSWTLDGAKVSESAVYTTTAVTESRSYVANFAFTPVTPRKITVLTSNASKGSVAITSPSTAGNTVTSGEIVTVVATPSGADNFFVNWTDGTGTEVSTTATYNYAKAQEVTLTANFVTKYVITITQTSGGTIAVKSGDKVLSDGERVAEGSPLTISITENAGKGLDQMLINGTDVYEE